MTGRSDDFEPGLPPDEREALARMSARLEAERPVPAAAFRGELRRRIAGGEARRVRGGALSPRRLAFGCLAAGGALLLLAAVGLADVGPLAPSDVAHAVASLLYAP
jgi:hypothetical protein